MAVLTAARRRAAGALALVTGRRPSLHSFGRARKSGFTRSIYGPWLKDTPGDRTFRFCVEGYGDFIPACIRAHDRPFLFLDIGANAGVFSLVASALPLCRGVVAFEPVPAVFDNLIANIAFNRATGITALRAAIAEAPGGEVGMSFDPAHSGISAIADGPNAAVTATALGADDLARLIADRGHSIFAKIDVEGAEADVISILGRTPFYAALNDMVVEVSEQNTDAATRDRLLAVLSREGFVMRGRDGGDAHYDAYFTRPRPGA